MKYEGQRVQFPIVHDYHKPNVQLRRDITARVLPFIKDRREGHMAWEHVQEVAQRLNNLRVDSVAQVCLRPDSVR